MSMVVIGPMESKDFPPKHVPMRWVDFLAQEKTNSKKKPSFLTFGEIVYFLLSFGADPILIASILQPRVNLNWS